MGTPLRRARLLTMNRDIVEEALEAQKVAFAQITSAIEQAQTIAICAHTSPDGDAIGSGLALAAILRQKYPQKAVTNLLADPDPVPRIYQFLPGTDQMKHADEYQENPDLFISIDLPCAKRLAQAEAVFDRSKHSVEFDHHPADEAFAEYHCIRPDAAATGVVIAEFGQYLGITFTSEVANDLFCAIMTDTGRFQYQNTNPEVFDIASLLVDNGADPADVSLHVYQSFRLEYLHLESIVLGRIVTFLNGRIAYSYATADDLKRTGAHLDECDGLIDAVRTVDGAEVALFLKELPDGKGVRGNLRSKGSLDISVVARELGGGGHRAAAGFTVDGDLDEALSACLPRLKALMTNDAFSARTGGVSE